MIKQLKALPTPKQDLSKVYFRPGDTLFQLSHTPEARALSVAEPGEKTRTSAATEQAQDPLQFRIPDIRHREFVRDLDYFFNSLRTSQKTSAATIAAIEECIFKIPIPIDSGVTEWGNIPSPSGWDIVNSFNSILRTYFILRGLEKSSIYQKYHCQFLVAYSVYTFADYASRLLPSTKLQGYHSQFWPALQHQNRFIFPFFLEGEKDLRFKAIETYFDQLVARNTTPLFYFAPEIDIKNGVKTISWHPFKTQDPCVDHLNYLGQFIDELKKNKILFHTGSTEENYINLWLQGIPIFNQLREISYFCFQLSYQGKCDVFPNIFQHDKKTNILRMKDIQENRYAHVRGLFIERGLISSIAIHDLVGSGDQEVNKALCKSRPANLQESLGLKAAVRKWSEYYACLR